MSKEYSKYCIDTGRGLQLVDGLETSPLFEEVTEKYIRAELTYKEAYDIIDSYYKNKEDRSKTREEEADKVAINIADILSDDSFVFSVGQYFSIHKRLFDGIFEHAGKPREYNFTKKEWVLDGASVSYGDYRELMTALDYDFSLERSYSYENKSKDEILIHLSHFVSNLWQIHAFEEGNTRTTAVFFIKYLRTLGFDVTNDTFAKNARFFRNALVRANYQNIQKNIFPDISFIKHFLGNLLFNEKNELENKYLSVKASYLKKNIIHLNEESKMVLSLLKENPRMNAEEIAQKIGKSLRSVKTILLTLKENGYIERVGGKRYGYWKIIKN